LFFHVLIFIFDLQQSKIVVSLTVFSVFCGFFRVFFYLLLFFIFFDVFLFIVAGMGMYQVWNNQEIVPSSGFADGFAGVVRVCGVFLILLFFLYWFLLEHCNNRRLLLLWVCYQYLGD